MSTHSSSQPKNGLPGVAVDAHGGAVVDPTENVIALSAASNLRQDDLRISNDKRLDAEISHVREVASLRADHAKEMRVADMDRLKSIREVDVTAVKTEADRALAAIQTLAAQTATNAENLRNALNTTATTIAKQTSDTVSQLIERIAALEKSSYEGKGKQTVSDPMMSELYAKMNTLIESRAEGHGKQTVADPMLAELVKEVKLLRDNQVGSTGKSQGINAVWLVILGIVTLISGAVSVVSFTRSSQVGVQPVAVIDKAK